MPESRRETRLMRSISQHTMIYSYASLLISPNSASIVVLVWFGIGLFAYLVYEGLYLKAYYNRCRAHNKFTFDWTFRFNILFFSLMGLILYVTAIKIIG